ncbi:MAG: hypothetical protein ACR2NG_05755 [Acidimicrobiia bacterium]
MTTEYTQEPTQIDKSDLEAKLREIEGVVLDVEESVRPKAAVIAVGVAVVVVSVVAFGIWRSRRNRIRIEVYRN